MAEFDSYYQYFYIHNTFGHFYYDTLKYFGEYLYPRFEHKVMGTFDKAVEYITKKSEMGDREVDKLNLPALILNPTGDFGLAEAMAGGKQLWRFPNLSPNLNFKIYEPIFQDANVMISPGFVRIKGEFDLYMLLNSFYEYCDLKMYLLQMFGGLERYIYPLYFNSFMIIPEELLNYEYNNNVTGTKYTLDWSGANVSQQLIRTINKTHSVIPLQLKPLYRLINLNDNSTKGGNTDKLAEWRLNATIEFECEFPWFLILKTDYLAENLNLSLNINSSFSSRDYTNIEMSVYHRSLNIAEGTHDPLTPSPPTLEEINDPDYNPLMTEYNEYLDQQEKDQELEEEINDKLEDLPKPEMRPPVQVEDGTIQINTQVTDKSFVLQRRYFYYYTENDHNEQYRIIINIPEPTLDLNNEMIVLYAEDIELKLNENYLYDISNNTIILLVQKLPYRVYKDDILDILIYGEGS